ncbi:MAG: C-GCAxxG-C-C family protein [Anaeromyxobacter sp.]
MTMEFGRRNWVKLIGGAGVAAAATRVLGETTAAPGAKGMAAMPWPYRKLDPAATGERAFKGYAKGHCMYGTFEALVGATAEQLGAEYQGFPYEMMTYGAGGVQGWATLCGCLNGAAAAFQILSPKPEPLTDALYSWYEKTALPDFVPQGTKFPNIPSVAGSPLCHPSISKWCIASKKKSFSAERKERCGVLTGAVAKKAAELLNDQLLMTAALPVMIDDATKKCASCHTDKGALIENARTKMSCGGCHFALGTKHKDI